MGCTLFWVKFGNAFDSFVVSCLLARWRYYMDSCFLGTEETIFILKTRKQALFTIPPGKKENVYFILNNERNTERRKQGKHSEFSGDCGAWNQGTSLKTVYEVKNNGDFRKLFVKNSLYCVEKQENSKRTYKPLDPQPDEESILELYRNYSTSKYEKSYRRCVTWFGRTPADMKPHMTNIAIVEYLGSFPGHRPHGNSQKTQQDYIRTPGDIMEDIGMEAKHRPPRQLYNDMNQDNSILEGPTDTKQIRNKKYHDKRKERMSSTTGKTSYHSNIADN